MNDHVLLAESSLSDLEIVPGTDVRFRIKNCVHVNLGRLTVPGRAAPMHWTVRVPLVFFAMTSGALAAEGSIRFWNLTRHTIAEFYLAPSGTANWGDNQCKNDKDGTVDSDERLRITGTRPGIYDARLKDISGRVCIVRNVKLEAGEIFSIEEKDLTSCDR